MAPPAVSAAILFYHVGRNYLQKTSVSTISVSWNAIFGNETQKHDKRELAHDLSFRRTSLFSNKEDDERGLSAAMFILLPGGNIKALRDILTRIVGVANANRKSISSVI
jgi:hypothetical protein